MDSLLSYGLPVSRSYGLPDSWTLLLSYGLMDFWSFGLPGIFFHTKAQRISRTNNPPASGDAVGLRK